MNSPDAPEVDDDVDLALRHLSQRLPMDLARALVPDAKTLTDCALLDTQVSARQRRMDRSLQVMADGRLRVEHTEWQTRWEKNLPRRVFEYHFFQSLALQDAAPKGARVPKVRSRVVLLGGRLNRAWPARGFYRTSEREDGFSGVRFTIDAVYQRTLRELRDRPGVLWMAFAPLAVDATPEVMPAVVRDLRERTSPPQFEEIAVAMSVLAGADCRARGLSETITALLPRELIMQSTIYKQGRAEGRTEGWEAGLREAILLALSTRHVRLSSMRRAQIEAETRAEVLQTWLRRAITATRAADVFAEP